MRFREQLFIDLTVMIVVIVVDSPSDEAFLAYIEHCQFASYRISHQQAESEA